MKGKVITWIARQLGNILSLSYSRKDCSVKRDAEAFRSLSISSIAGYVITLRGLLILFCNGFAKQCCIVTWFLNTFQNINYNAFGIIIFF